MRSLIIHLFSSYRRFRMCLNYQVNVSIACGLVSVVAVVALIVWVWPGNGERLGCWLM
jgi:hypothetical protein